MAKKKTKKQLAAEAKAAQEAADAAKAEIEALKAQIERQGIELANVLANIPSIDPAALPVKKAFRPHKTDVVNGVHGIEQDVIAIMSRLGAVCKADAPRNEQIAKSVFLPEIDAFVRAEWGDTRYPPGTIRSYLTTKNVNGIFGKIRLTNEEDPYKIRQQYPTRVKYFLVE
jgi:hypothetical protein